MRRAVELWDRNHYSRLVGVWRSVQILSQASERHGVRAFLLEARFRDWDDLVEEHEGVDGRRSTFAWQVKNQATAFARGEFASYLGRLHETPAIDRGVFASRYGGAVEKVGRLDTLAELCERARAAGDRLEDLRREETKDEARWWQFIAAELGANDPVVAALLRRLEIRRLQDEVGLREDAILPALGALYEAPVERVFDTLVARVLRMKDVDRADVLWLEELLREHEERRRPTRRGLAHARRDYLAGIGARYEGRGVLGGAEPSTRVPMAAVWTEPRQTRTELGTETRTLRDELRAAPGRPAKVLVLGTVGSGKTELLHRTVDELRARAVSDHRASLPLFVDARLLGSASGDPGAALSALMPIDARQRQTLWEAPRAAGISWTLLVDRFDEASADARDRVTELAQSLGERLDAIVVASRPTHRPTSGAWTEIWLAPWRSDDAMRFVEAWRAHDAGAAENVIARVSDPAIQTMLETPLTATMVMIAAKGRRPRALRSRARLFDEVVRGLFQRWAERRREGQGGLVWKDVAGPLRTLALRTLKTSAPITRDDLVDALAVGVHDDEDAAERTAELHLGVLVRRRDEYDFVIRGLAEHLAGRQLDALGEVEDAAAQAWGEEAARHAIGIAAMRSQDEAEAILRGLTEDDEPDLMFGDPHLRRVRVALRAASDLDEVSAATAERLEAAAFRRLVDESSEWIGDRVAAATRELMAKRGALAERFRARAEKIVSDPGERILVVARAPSDGPEHLLPLLLEYSPEIRSVALQRLEPWVKDSRVQRALWNSILDEALGPGMDLPPAAAAGWVLRNAPRTEGLLRGLQRLLAASHPLRRGSAALALHPHEAPAPALAKALHDLQGVITGFGENTIPAEVLQELARTEDGGRALEDHFPDWRSANRRRLKFGRGSGSLLELPASPSVRSRIAAAILPGLTDDPDALHELSNYLHEIDRGLMIVEGAVDNPAVLESVVFSPEQRPFLRMGGQEALGRAAARHPTLRAKLLELWSKTVERGQAELRSHYPGTALEALVARGDAEAIQVYAAWLPHSPAVALPAKLPPIASEVLAPEPIRSSACRIARRVFAHAAEGETNDRGERTFLSTNVAAAVLRRLRSAWLDDAMLRAKIAGWLGSAERDERWAALKALEGLSLGEDERTRVVEALTERVRGLADEASVDDRFFAPELFELVAQHGVARALEGELRDLVRQRLEWTAPVAAVLIEAGVPDRKDLSLGAAEHLASSSMLHELGPRLLRALLAEAPDAWATAIERDLEGRELGTDALAALIDALPAAEKRRVGMAWSAGRGADEVLWRQDPNHVLRTYRPADRLRRIFFDAGIDATFPSQDG